MNDFIKNFNKIILVDKPKKIIKNDHKLCLIFTTIQELINKSPSLLPLYKLMFKYINFDDFAKIKELYSSNVYKFIPSWSEYFTQHNILHKCIKTNKDPIRLIFTKIKSAKSFHSDIVRSPFYINIDDIEYANYYKLFKFLILTYYNINERFNASKLTLCGKKHALETNCAYIIFDGIKIKSLNHCIETKNENGIKYLIEEVGIKPTWNQLNIIEENFSEYITDMASYYFE